MERVFNLEQTASEFGFQ